MKLRRFPEDFIVEEHLKPFPISREGEYTLLRVSKKDMTTRDLVRILARTFKIPQKNISPAGQKDRHALTIQYLTVKGRLPPVISGRNFRGEVIGRTNRPLTPEDIAFNRFEITLRDLKLEEAEEIPGAVEKIKAIGFPNYYDTQRFWSALSGEFFGEHLLKGNYRKAFKLYLLSSLRSDSELMKRLKSKADFDIEEIEEEIEGNAKKVLEVFKRENSYLKALRSIEKEELKFLINVYQSFLFNEILSRFIRKNAKKYKEVRYSMGFLPFHREKLPGVDETTRIPVPGRKPFFDDRRFEEIYSEIKEERGIKDSYFNRREIYFAKFKSFKRSVLAIPEEVILQKCERDIYPARLSQKLIFNLPPGSYATVFIKALIAQFDEDKH